MERATTSRAGFTIIEVVLVLAITGLLVSGVLVGTGVSVNIQRYRDSVISLQSIIQEQYSRVTSVQNDRRDTLNCTDGQVFDTGSRVVVRGQTSCVLLGRILLIDNNEVTQATVTGSPEQTTPANATDVDILRTYTLGVVPSSIEHSQLEWGVKLAWPLEGSGARAQGADRTVAILVIRSPETGTVYTFTADTPRTVEEVTPSVLHSMLVAGSSIPGQAGRTLCIDSKGLVFSGNLSVILAAAATGASAIQTSSNDILENQGGTTRC